MKKIVLLALVAMVAVASNYEKKKERTMRDACIDMCIDIETKTCKAKKCPKTQDQIKNECKQKEECYKYY